jgi:HAD superfamily hydrolase (TIGR01484 family)
VEKKFSDLFAFDLDGTLVHDLANGERGIDQPLIEIIAEISKRAHIVVATGRRYRAALRDLVVLPKMPYTVLHNGLVVKDTHGQTVERHEVPTETAVEIARMLQKSGVEFFVAVDGYEEKIDFIFFESQLKRSQDLRSVFERTQGFNEVLGSVEDLSNFSRAPVLEIVSVAAYDVLRKFQAISRQLLPDVYQALLVKNIGVPGVGALEIFPRSCSKWTGVDYVKRKLGAERVIAVGDDENDIEMIKSADIGLVMDHAEPHVKAASTQHLAGPMELKNFLKDFYR